MFNKMCNNIYGLPIKSCTELEAVNLALLFLIKIVFNDGCYNDLITMQL